MFMVMKWVLGGGFRWLVAVVLCVVLNVLSSGLAVAGAGDDGVHLEVGRFQSTGSDFGPMNGTRIGIGFWSDDHSRDTILKNLTFWLSGQSGEGADVYSSGLDYGFLPLHAGPVYLCPRARFIGAEYRRTADEDIVGLGIGAGLEAGVQLGPYVELALTGDYVLGYYGGSRREVGLTLRVITKRFEDCW